MNELNHLDDEGRPRMVDVSAKNESMRWAEAEGRVWLPKEVLSVIVNNELHTSKGPVFQTAIIAGIMAAKKTPELIPMCHPLNIEDCRVKIHMEGDEAVIRAETRISGRTGVEMEALTAVSIAALTIYDMCKKLSHRMEIRGLRLIAKRGGQRDVG